MGPFSKKSDEQTQSQNNTTPGSVSNDTAPAEMVTTAATPQPVVKKEKHSRAFSFVSVLFLLALLGAGVLAYMWYNQMAEVTSLNTELTQAKSDQDILKKQVADLKKDGSAVPVTETVAKSDDDMIKEAVAVYNHAYQGNEKTKYNVTVTKKDTSFAHTSVNSSSEGSGFACWLKKVDGAWLVLVCGQDNPSQEQINRWGIPKEYVS